MIVSSDDVSFAAPSGFIVLEGVNGAGKSTLLSTLSRYLQAAGHSVLETREPGAGDFGVAVRSLVLSPTKKPRSPWAEFFLFAADRAEHVAGLISPALQSRKLVLCDRYCYSSEAFQGFGRGLDLEEIRRVNSVAVQGVFPDLVFLLDLPAEEGLRRNTQLQKGDDSFEQEDLEFHTRLRDGFLAIARDRPEPFVVLDARQSAEHVAAEAMKVLKRYLYSY